MTLAGEDLVGLTGDDGSISRRNKGSEPHARHRYVMLADGIH